MKAHVESPHELGEQQPEIEWVSDALAELLRRLDVPFISLNPGASYRGLHDSLVNYLGNERPQMIVCLHEEHAVAVAHGYAKATGKPMAVALHSNVGLMHATMAIYNAFCDRVPMLLLGATGPLDAAKRRPWIDWIHTSADQSALVRNYVKFDDQPTSMPAALESLLRAHVVTRSYPPAPTYVCLDSALQESEISEPPCFPELERFQPPAPPAPATDQVVRALELLRRASHPVLLFGRVGSSRDSWEARVALAERLGAAVLSDLKTGAVFPSDHPLHPAAPGTFLTPSGRELLAEADVVLALDWIDLGGTLRQAEASPTVIACTADQALHNGWSKDHFGLSPVDLAITAHPDLLVDALLALLGDGVAAVGPAAGSNIAVGGPAPAPGRIAPIEPPGASASGGEITIRALARSLHGALAGGPACLVRLPLGWDGADLHLQHPLDYLGQDGGAGLGSGPGMTVGAALAFDGSPRLAVGVLGDGDTLMGAPALWTAAHYGLGMLVVVANNRSFFNDEVHQQRVAMRRHRPVGNRWIGQHMRDPEPDLAVLARSLGLVGHGPVTELEALDGILTDAVAAARDGAAVLVDVHVASTGYPSGVTPTAATPGVVSEPTTGAGAGARAQ